MGYLQYNFVSTLKMDYYKDTVKDFYLAKTGTNIYDTMGVWGRVVLDESGNMCNEGVDVTLKDRIYYYRLSTKI